MQGVPGVPPPGSAGYGVSPSFDPEAVRPGQEPAIDGRHDLPCRMRLRGVLGKNGAFAVQNTASPGDVAGSHAEVVIQSAQKLTLTKGWCSAPCR
jgi:hypothetical protein